MLAQMKVTKAKGLNTHLCGALGCRPEALFEAPRSSTRFLLDPSSLRDFIGRNASATTQRVNANGSLAARRRRARDSARKKPFSAPLAESLGQEASQSSEANSIRQDFEAAKRRAHAKRKRFSSRGRRKSGALTQQMSGQMCVQALCFGDFHLCQQMKVTRPPGRDPAPMWSTGLPAGRRSHRGRWTRSASVSQTGVSFPGSAGNVPRSV